MTVTAFDTLKTAKTLTKAGFTKKQADAQVEVLIEMTNELATKKDIEDLKLATKKDIEDLKLATKKDIEDLKLATEKDLELLGHSLTNSLTIRISGIAAIVIGIVKYLPV